LHVTSRFSTIFKKLLSASRYARKNNGDKIYYKAVGSQPVGMQTLKQASNNEKQL
jgi:hypothetical protein